MSKSSGSATSRREQSFVSLGQCIRKGYISISRGHQGGTVGLKAWDIAFKNQSGT